MRRIIFHAFVLAALIFSLNTQPNTARAQASTAQELVAAVNAVRASHDLAPYTVDPGLMAFAQSRSDYQASIRKITHAMADGSQPADHGVFENIGGGQNASVSTVINYQWKDYWHQHTMIGFTEGYIGAGVATADGFVYYTLVVRRTGGFTYIQPTAAPSGSTSAPGQSADEFVLSIVTSTPASDGLVVHKVASGETLWTIAEAYGTTIDELASLNGLNAANPVIFTGRDLIIRAAHTPTPTVTITATPEPSPTSTATRRPTRTPRLTATPSPEGISQQMTDLTSDNRSAAVVVTLAIGIGLLLLVTFGIKDKK